MRFVEVVVNVPLGRAFARPALAAPEDQEEPVAARPEGDEDEAPVPYQTFTYHLPVDLEDVVRPGHLVWAPFGKRTIQGVVVGMVEETAIQTRPILRLARPEPVLEPWQLELAAWIANDYVAPIAETVRLLLPPGLLKKSPETLGVQSKRDWQVTLNERERVEAGLAALGNDRSPAGRLLQWFLDHPGAAVDAKTLRTEANLKSGKPIEDALTAGWIVDEEGLRLAIAKAEARRLLEEVRGVARYRQVVDALAGLGGDPVWRDELTAQVRTPLAVLQQMADAGVLLLEERIRFRDPMQGRLYARTRAPRLTTEQADAWALIKREGYEEQREGARRFLLHGVTGSGKTEIYLRAIGETLKQGRQAIVLVPEIALTPQTVARFAGRYPGKVTVIHSAMNTGERYDVWRALRAGEFDIVVGPRSALFAPMARLGLIIIDEEHESSYKQDSEAWAA